MHCLLITLTLLLVITSLQYNMHINYKNEKKKFNICKKNKKNNKKKQLLLCYNYKNYLMS